MSMQELQVSPGDAASGARVSVGHSVMIGLGALAFALLVITPLSVDKQIMLGVGSCILAVLFARGKGEWVKYAMATVAFAMASRYLYWRLTETLHFRTPSEAFLGYGMLAAEAYLWVVFALSFVQSLQVRERKPAPLPQDESLWPTVDVLIPTYNESLDIVSATVLAARQMDYPEGKFNVYILDDGRRPEFARFAAEAGVGYITRGDNKHAKAGNLNHALAQTDGELVAIFDCDHVPTRGFLQLTVGWFLKDPRMALIQTPHYFYNRDPFEKNLAGGDKIANEGLLFYGMLQAGNDFWNASFFCGSCAVLRRTALMEVGGIAVETVTEDAHTSLKLQRRGWNTGFLRRPLAAGLATESLAIHIGQRMRWARGMIQIFRLDNPLFGPGLTLAQRLCYLNAMVHFLFPLPRFILLTAPLAFLLFGQQIIWAGTTEIMAYVLPYLVIATICSKRLQGSHRQPFWGEIYETVLSLHLLRPTIQTLFKPKGGKFNVTSKGELHGQSYMDLGVLRGQIALTALMVSAAIYGLVAIAFFHLPPDVAGTTAINVLWAAISILVLLVTVGVGVEARELRSAPRIRTNLQATVHLADGRAFATETVDVSVKGARIKAADIDRDGTQELGIEMNNGDSKVFVPADCVGWTNNEMRIAFRPSSVDDQAGLVGAVLGRTNAWRNWDQWPQGSVVSSFQKIFASVGGLFRWVAQRLKRDRKAAYVAGAIAAAVLAVGQEPSYAQEAPVAAAAPPAVIAPVASPIAGRPPAPAPFGRGAITLALDDFGVLEPIRLQGRSNTRGVGFSLRSDQVVSAARISIPVAYSPNLDPATSQLTIELNGQVVYATQINPVEGTSQTIQFDVNPYLFLRDNNLVFKLSGRRVGDRGAKCGDDQTVWAQVSNKARIMLQVERVSLPPDLANLPMPFFDPRDASQLNLPFVFASRPSLATIEAAAVVASFWGVETSYRGAKFPTSFAMIPDADAVVFLTAEDRIAGLDAPEILGPSVAVVQNPIDPQYRLLLVMGRDGKELLDAARALSLGANMVSGQIAAVRAPTIAERKAYDAPRWVSTDRTVKLGEFVEANGLEGRGLSPGVLTANMRTAPDFFAWGGNGVPMTVRYRTPGEQWIDLDRSRLDVLVNDKFVASLPLRESRGVGLLSHSEKADFTAREGQVRIPPYLLYGQSKLQFYFDLRAREEGECPSEPGEIRTAIDLDSEINLTQLHRFTRMPNLAFMAQSGFPFTKMADLSQTAIILSPDFNEKQLEALFRMMASFGDKTGYPAVRVRVAFPEAIDSFADRDLLVIGEYGRQPLLQQWSKFSAIEFNGDMARIRSRSAMERITGNFASLAAGESPRDELHAPAKSLNGAMISFRSPLAKDRTVVFVAARDGAGLVSLAEALASKEDSPRFQGDFVMVSGENITSLAVAEPYYIGSLPPLMMLKWQIAQRAWATPGLMGLSLLLLSGGTFAAMRRRARVQKEEEDGSSNEA